MKANNRSDPVPPNGSSKRRRWLWLIIVVCALVMLVGLFPVARRVEPVSDAGSTNSDGKAAISEFSGSKGAGRARFFSRRSLRVPAPTAEEIVAGKVSQFGRSRREIVRRIARRAGKEVPPEVEKFFDAIESGHWEEIQAQWRALAKWSGQYEYSEDARPDLNPYWSAVLDAYGAAEQAHLWPAQELLDYGNAILDSLRPGMVYVGGTDNGRWVPELLNDTGDGENHVIITQNALADGRYLDYLTELYGDRVHTLTEQDSQRAFEEYMADARRRLEHDQQYPDEPKQVRPGEDLSVVDGKVQVKGQVAVMAVNEKLLQAFMAKNPELSFALQESFPLHGTYADALPLGPLMELRAQDGQNAFTAERAAQSLDYWRNAAQQILAGPGAAASPDALKSYSHDAVAAANLLAAHQFTAEAEQAYRLAAQLWPGNPESTGALADLLARNGRENEARQLLDDFARQHPGQMEALRRASSLWTATFVTAPSPAR